MRDCIEVMRSERGQRLDIVSDLYRVLLDGLTTIFILLLMRICVRAEGLLDDRSGVLSVMENEGLQHILGDIIVSESDPLLLV